MSPVAILLNPRANAGRAARRFEALLSSDVGKQLSLERAPRWEGDTPGLDLQSSAESFVRDQLETGIRRFVAVGGDGTVHLAINSLMNASQSLGIPSTELTLGAAGAGSSNDFQKPYSAPGRHPIGDFHTRLDFEQAFLHDLGRVESDQTKPYYFAINASVGVTADANAQFNASGPWVAWLKRNAIDLAILVTALRTFVRYQNQSLELSIQGASPSRLALTNCGVVKNIHFSGDLRYDLPQPPNDGLFGIHLCRDMSKLALLKMFSALSKGHFSGLPNTSSQQASMVSFRPLAHPLNLETDGEVRRFETGTVVRLLALKEAIRICP